MGLAQTDERCFAETGLCTRGRVRQFWEQNGGLPVFGLPISPPAEEGAQITSQWFERNRLEWHPEEPESSPYRIQLGLLGRERLQQLGRDPFLEGRETGPRPGCLWFEETGHNVCNQGGQPGFKTYWESKGLTDPRLNMTPYQRSLALFGLPLTEAKLEVSATDGKTYLTQWFERARFEWHPENQDPYRLLLGLLGSEVRAGGGGAPAPPPARRIAFTSTRDGNEEIYLVNPDGSGLVNLSNHPGKDVAPSWSPDGSRLAFTSNRNGNEEIYVVNADGSGVVNLTNHPGSDGRPAWSPDGARIAFNSDRDGNQEIYVMNADGSGLVRLTDNGASDQFPAWSPDGGRISFTSNRDGNQEIYVMNADGSGATNLTRHPSFDVVSAWSPDGARIAFSTTRNGKGEVYLMNADGSGLVNLSKHPEGDGFPAWSPDGTRIVFFSSRDGGDWEIYVMNADGSGQTRLTSQPGADWWPAWR